jgi:transposase
LLEAEIDGLDAQLAQLTAAASPHLTSTFAIGADTAGGAAAGRRRQPRPAPLRRRLLDALRLLTDPRLLRQTRRHRLNRGGNRQANAALDRIVLVRMRYHQPTKAYVQRRTNEGKSTPEIIRCLKRYVARDVYTALRQSGEDKPPSRLTSTGA